MNILKRTLERIPYGHENAIQRRDLTVAVFGNYSEYNDRKMRNLLPQIRRNHPVLNMQDGKGYFRPILPDELSILTKWEKQEERRLKTTAWGLRGARKAIRDAGA